MELLNKMAMQKAIAVSAEIEVQLEAERGCNPLVTVLQRARADAAEALWCLAAVDSENAKEIRALQNRVVRFTDLVGWLTAIVQEGFEADSVLSAEDREDFAEALAGGRVDQEEAVNPELVGGNYVYDPEQG